MAVRLAEKEDGLRRGRRRRVVSKFRRQVLSLK